MTQNPTPVSVAIPAEFQRVFDLQRAAHLQNMSPPLEQRQADLLNLRRMVAENADAMVEAVNKDYGCRCTFETKFAEIFMAQEAAREVAKQVKKWMRPKKRHLDMMEYPLAKAWTLPQPVGVVGSVVPWNFPIAMALQPLIGAFAAGNRAMIKMSENSNHLAQLFKKISGKYFPEDKLAFFEDGHGQGPAFTMLPFDHIFFTGSPATGRAVMANAARNLTPVTLELGGKSPCVVAPDYSMKTAAERVMWAKMLNAGQICTNVDYIFLPEGKVDEFIQHAQAIVTARYPDLTNGDNTAIIDQRAYDRLQETLADATARGARTVSLAPGQNGDAARRIMAPQAIINAPDDSIILSREIFGPLLPIKTYRSHDEVIQYINARPRPLALYIYSNDTSVQNLYLHNTISGGVGINEAVIQAGLHDLPFGGSGNSGMGHYHGYEGFLTFSKLKPVFKQGPYRGLDNFLPPYKGKAEKMLNLMFKLKG